jgi:hypothetical protein
METTLSIRVDPARITSAVPAHYRLSPRRPSPRYPERRVIVHRPGCALVRGRWEVAAPDLVLGVLLAPGLQARLCRRCTPLGAAGAGLNERMRDCGWDDHVLNDLRVALGVPS